MNLVGVETLSNYRAVHDILELRATNHVLTGRVLVRRHDKQIRDLKKKGKEVDSNDGDKDEEERWKDQGYTRPIVLALLPRDVPRVCETGARSVLTRPRPRGSRTWTGLRPSTGSIQSISLRNK